MGLGPVMDALGLSQPADPVITNLPRSVQAFQNKYTYQGDWQPLAQVIPAMPENVRATLIRADQERVVKGAQPANVEDTALALQTLLTGQPATKPPKARNPITDLPNAVFRDVRDITRSIPRLPLALFQEVQEIGKFPQRFAEEKERTGNPLSALAASPGVRLLPGSFVVENVAGGTPGELLRRPVFTALDVGPFASKGVKAAAANPLVQERVAAIRGSQPYRTLATSNIATKTQEAFGGLARDASYKFNTALAKLGDWTDPKRKVPDELWVDDPEMAREIQTAKDTRALMERYEIEPDRMGEITRAAQLDDLDSVNPLDEERAFVGEYKDMQKRWEDYALTRTDVADSIRSVLDPVTGTTEVFPAKQAARILASRSVARYHRDFSYLRNIATVGDGSISDVLNTISPYLTKEIVGDVGRRRSILVAGENALRSGGFTEQANILRDAVTDLFQRKNATAANEKFDLLRTAEDAPAVIRPATRESILDSLRTIKDPRLARAETLIQARAWANARQSIRAILNRPLDSAHVPVLEQAIKDIRRARTTERFINSTTQYTDKRAAQLEARAAKRYRTTLPARFQPLVEQETKARLTTTLQELPDLPDDVRTKLIEDVAERNFTNLSEAGIDVRDVRRIQRQAAATWTEMKEAGLNPVFVHRVHPDIAHVINFPTVKAQITTPSQVKARAMDATPHYDNLTVALNHQALEWLTRRAITEFVDGVEKAWARPHDELYNKYVPHARQRHAQRPDLDINSHVNQLMNREWTKFDPTARFAWMKGRATGMSKQEMYVPKVVANTIERFFNDNPGLFSQLTAPVMNGFRTSVLTLSPRWHVYNILGGMVMMMARTDPITVWRHLGAARQMLRDGTAPDLLRGELGKASLSQQDLAYARGVKMSEFVQTAKDKVPGLETGTKGFNWLTDKSWKFNMWVDDMYRSMSYLYGYDKSLTKNMTKEQAIRAGVELSRKIMPDWNSMTPIERNVIRSVFPFYGFMSHVLRYVMQYPADHPVRASIISNFARAELNDMEEATPTRFAEVMAFGSEDEDGTRRALTSAGFNPFSGAADIFTTAGFLSQVNPLLGAALEQAGLKRGTANLHPDVRYDPDTGRLALQSPNPIANLFAKTLPQLSLLTQLANPTSELNRMRASNPDVGETIVRGALGVPRLVVPFNEMDEQMKAELNRREAYNKARAEALKTGIDAQAKAYPQLAAYLDQLRALQSSQPELFTAYAPGSYTESLGIEQTEGVSAIGEAQRVLLGELIRR